eukprot:TRINITY_DN1837_c0_g1_i7.p1 TRINITY_DN1837_c0_g1~~TRINITY_DN1837_c0_g1_i7.p1  ORF type:complete len:335 (+),score=72.30 TRINITY_DN1837_c0_g1_i7:448-1452(+)
MFEVSTYSSALQPGITTQVSLVARANYFASMTWVGPQIPWLILIEALALVKLAMCTRALMLQFPVIRAIRRLKDVTAAQGVLLLEVLSSGYTVIHVVDFVGQFHLLPLPIWFNLMMWSYLFTVTSTFILAKAMLSAEAMVRHEKFERKRSILLNLIFGAFFLINSVVNVLVGCEVYFTVTVVAISTVSLILFQIVLATHFLVAKRRMLNLLSIGVMSRDVVQLDQVKNLRRMSFYMYISGFLILGYLLSMVVPAVGNSLGSIEIVIYSNFFAVIFNSLTGLSQVLSLPEKITGIKFSGSGGVSGDAAEHPSRPAAVISTEPKQHDVSTKHDLTH